MGHSSIAGLYRPGKGKNLSIFMKSFVFIVAIGASMIIATAAIERSWPNFGLFVNAEGTQRSRNAGTVVICPYSRAVSKFIGRNMMSELTSDLSHSESI
jgi:hypothetical protein